MQDQLAIKFVLLLDYLFIPLWELWCCLDQSQMQECDVWCNTTGTSSTGVVPESQLYKWHTNGSASNPLVCHQAEIEVRVDNTTLAEIY